MHLSNWFIYCTLYSSQVSLSSRMCHLSLFGVWKKKNKEQYTQKFMKILRTASLGSNFTGSYKKGCISLWFCFFNPCHATDLFLYPQKTSKSRRFSNVFRGCRKTSDMKWVKIKVNTVKAFYNVVRNLNKSRN